MLHATFANGKSTQYKRYNGFRENDGIRDHEEDEITSTILGPLDFLEPKEVLNFWRELLVVADKAALLPHFVPERVSVQLWPSRSASLGGVRIEPDAHVVFYWTDQVNKPQQFTLLVEVKWRAPLSGDNQLQRQWLDYLETEERENSLHIFLGLDIAAGEAALLAPKGKVWKGRLVLLTWWQAREVFSKLAGQSAPLNRWAKLCERFLDKVGVRRYLGFSKFARYPQSYLSHWRPPFFWGQASNLGASNLQQNAPKKSVIFWSNER